MVVMKFALNQQRFGWPYQGGIKRILQKLLYMAADAIGFCVAEIRWRIVPAVRAIWTHLKPKHSIGRSEEPSFVRVSYQGRDQQCFVMTEEMATGYLSGDLKDVKSSKKYTYDWAVARIAELEAAGVSDPVCYFNNEMGDWWLAPDGMMEEEADFLGIARAIEERWHH